MYLKTSLITLLKSQLILLAIVFIFLVSLNHWGEDGGFGLFLLCTVYQMAAFSVFIASLFAEPNESEKLLDDAIMNGSSTLVKIIGSLLVIIVPAFFVPEEASPYPISIYFILATVSMFYSFFAMISQRAALVLGDIMASPEDLSFPRQLIRFLSSVHIYPVYHMISRIHSLPWYARKPVAVMIFISWAIGAFSIFAVLEG